MAAGTGMTGNVAEAEWKRFHTLLAHDSSREIGRTIRVCLERRVQARRRRCAASQNGQTALHRPLARRKTFASLYATLAAQVSV
jgi:hypothetical protein